MISQWIYYANYYYTTSTTVKIIKYNTMFTIKQQKVKGYFVWSKKAIKRVRERKSKRIETKEEEKLLDFWKGVA